MRSLSSFASVVAVKRTTQAQTCGEEGCWPGRRVLAGSFSSIQIRIATHGDEDELRLAGAQGLQGAPVAEDDLTRLDDEGKLEYSGQQRRLLLLVRLGD